MVLVLLYISRRPFKTIVLTYV